MYRHLRILAVAAVLVFILLGVFYFKLTPDMTFAAIHVANNGTDSSTCGSFDKPCRSISQAITNAKVGDTVKVGPGRYGDLNNNGTLAEPGEEFAKGYGMITVDKPVTVVSSAGSTLTVLDGGGARLSTLLIAADNVVIGKPEHGFTITGAKANGLSTASISNVTISGNHVLGNGQGGLVVDGNANLVHHNHVSGNLAAGIAIFGSENEVRNNTSSSNGSEGFVIVGTKHAVHNNGASNNSIGFGIQGTDIRLSHNTALGNKLFGISIETLGAGATISNNDIYGNNAMALNGLTNCAIQNLSGSTIIATDNYWGDSNGVGDDPADNAGSGSGCDSANSITIVIPFANESLN